MKSAHSWSVLLSLAAVWLGHTATSVDAQTPLTTVRIANGFSLPTDLQVAPGDDTRLFVLEQRGDIEIIKNGVALGTSFLDISPKVSSSGNERGLLGLAFHPDYQNNGQFFVCYTRSSDHASVIERYTVSANPDIANSASGTIIFGPVAQPFSNHNGGCIEFGPDGKLYLGLGDGGSGGDPGCRAQNGLNLLGKIIRLNPDGTIPVDNPFVGNPNVLDQIWALGVRNPWRFSFDRDTGALYIADVGQGPTNPREEIDFQSGASNGGENYGWKVMEGTLCFSTSGCTGVAACNSPTYTNPFRNFGHGGGVCSVTGGYVYRGDAIPDLKGAYFHADYCSNDIWSIRYDEGAGSSVAGSLVTYTGTLNPPGQSINQITSFGQDNNGEIYFVDQGGEIFQLISKNDFTGLGCELPGANGDPVLWGEGSVAPGQPGTLHLDNAAPGKIAILFVATSSSPVNFFGGTLKPFPFLDPFYIFVTDGLGNVDASWTDLGANPPGTEIYLQYAIDDPGAIFNVALSNALLAVVP